MQYYEQLKVKWAAAYPFKGTPGGATDADPEVDAVVSAGNLIASIGNRGSPSALLFPALWRKGMEMLASAVAVTIGRDIRSWL